MTTDHPQSSAADQPRSIRSAILGFPRIGARRELKFAAETFWRGDSDATALDDTAAQLRTRHWHAMRQRGIDVIPSNDFSLYDQMLDMIALVGAIPRRFGWQKGQPVDHATYFACARGTDAAPAMEMTKWFDTNYHYIVPEFGEATDFTLARQTPLDMWREAKALGIDTRPVIIGPLTFLLLGKSKTPGLEPLSLLPKLLPVYEKLLAALKGAGVEWVQIDEPILATDLPEGAADAFRAAYETLAPTAPRIMLATYFDRLADSLDVAANLPVAGLHVDCLRGADDAPRVAETLDGSKTLSLGLIDGRNIWRADLDKQLATARKLAGAHDGDIEISTSCSLLHVPVDLSLEKKLDPELQSWLAFATQKLDEVSILTRGLRDGSDAIAPALKASTDAASSRANSPYTRNPAVRTRLAELDDSAFHRASAFEARRAAQGDLGLPPLPTTTIGSFPQTSEVRKARAANRRGDMSDAAYKVFLQQETEATIRRQEELGIDVLVHGEFERTDMVEFFGEKLEGFAFTGNGWVQSYGSRCVRPPVIFGDVSRPEPMTVEWARYAQSLTDKPVKGMLTGPITILHWSFVRDDQPRADTCRQIALAIRDEVVDLEAAGIRIIQVDEPAVREGLPLRHKDQAAYLAWAVACFRLSASGVTDRTQIHTHMCYSEFNDIMESIADFDADVISIETSRSDMELLSVFGDFHYPNDIGPGIWDIHSPRVPGAPEIERLIGKAVEVIDPAQLWVNPDCGLKTRGWPEVEASLTNMVTATKAVRARLSA
jgi:5-methyltetrahydropteroyltriglutamate--homocysteine methyltransferase